MTATEKKLADESDFFSKLLLSPEKSTYTEEEIEDYNQNLEKYIETEVSKRVLAIEAKLAEESNKVANDKPAAAEKSTSLISDNDAKEEKRVENSSHELPASDLPEASLLKKAEDENVKKTEIEDSASVALIAPVTKAVEKKPNTITSTDFDDVADTPSKSVHKYLNKDRDELSFIFEDVEREYQEMRSENDRLKEENDRLAFELDDSKNKLKVFEKLKQRNKEKKSQA
ncbi:hypothetical protein D0Z00_001586 [Geotrichum galactomycetum]|uniref:Uncharacterized protein n=1 Tax=Geotrichum galactomycetum TaxID=27317 RepID=A0ACB6V6P5_9ASCO|nr:hypothetical protein D0Z00_001586 [Geotrichum candidum]